MIRVAVQLPPAIGDVGEYLADATALEAAGAETIWLDDSGVDPWVVLGALAVVTRRVGLGCLLSSAAGLPPSQLAAAVGALQIVSRGRVVIGLPSQGKLTSQLAALRRVRARIFTKGSPHTSADGVILGARSADQIDVTRAKHIEVWAAIALPPDREAWSQVLSDYETAGAAGVIVQWDARIVDLLRNPEPDDRTDLLISTG